MKTIVQIAEELNTTPSNVYHRLKVSKISLKRFESRYQGKNKLYGEEAERVIKGLFEDNWKEPESNCESNQSMNSNNSNIPSVEAFESLKKELEEAREAEAAAQKEIARQKEQIQQLMNQVSGLIDAQKALSLATAANRLQAAQEIAEPIPPEKDPTQEKKGLFNKIKGLLKGNKTS